MKVYNVYFLCGFATLGKRLLRALELSMAGNAKRPDGKWMLRASANRHGLSP